MEIHTVVYSWRSLLVALCVVILSRHATSQHDCVQIQFLNEQKDVIRSAVNRDINITFAVLWFNCSSYPVLTVAVNNSSRYPNLDVECRVLLDKDNCSVSDSSVSCYCMSPIGPVTFSKRFNKTTSITYVWTWYSGSEKKEKAITFHVFEETPASGHMNDHKTVVAVVLGSLGMLIVVGIIIVIFICLKSVRRSRDLLPLQGDSEPRETRKLSGNSKFPLTRYEEPWDSWPKQTTAGCVLLVTFATPPEGKAQPDDWAPEQIYSNTNGAEDSDQIYNNLNAESCS